MKNFLILCNNIENGGANKIEKQQPITELLRKTRRKRGYTISRVVADLNINEEFIRALEDGQLGKLPSQSYTLGFVKAYAKYLKINPYDAVENFKRTYDLQTESFLGAPSEEEKKDLPLNEKINFGLSSFYNSKGTIIFAIVVLGIFLGYRILLSRPRIAAPVFYEIEEEAVPPKKDLPTKAPEKSTPSAEKALLKSINVSVDKSSERR